jgi:hypothetical protein
VKELREVWQKLHEFCAAREWRGYDPYDGLNSPLARLLPGKAARQAWTQFHRRSPINFRPLCRIEPTLNPKALALFAMGSGDAKFLELLEQWRSPDGGWGYPFDWQSRAFFAARGTSNLICTAFAARAFREVGNRGGDAAPTTAREFIEKHLLRERNGERWITYIGHSDTQVHNVNMIGAALLGRRDCMEFSVKRQRADGSWWYGEAENQRWIDNFHTGYCLAALKEYEATTGDKRFAESGRRGFEYWERTFWHEDGAPRYYHDEMYPLDCHCSAQGILTYLVFGNLTKANFVARWALENMWDERGFFWYQRGRRSANRICYMRWTQAWMYCALAKLIKANETANR